MKDDLDEIFDKLREKNSNESLILFIGISFVLMGILHVLLEFSDIFLISATVAGYFFIVSEMNSFDENRSKTQQLWSDIFMFLAVFSFIALPAILLSYSRAYSLLSQYSSVFTLSSLGAVLILLDMNVKKNNSKKNELLLNKIKDMGESYSKVIENYKLELNTISEKINEVEKIMSEERLNEAEPDKN